LSERNTVQKQIILDVLKSFNTHPSVDELYAEIFKVHPSISKATIYRNVKQLADKGEILQLAVPNDVSRYDGCTDFHHHFVCDSCGGVFDVHADCIDATKEVFSLIQNKHGFKVDRSMTSFFGACSTCAESS